MNNVKSELTDILTIHPHPLNPKIHSPAKLDKLARHIKREGWDQPIVVNSETKIISKGHARYFAALLLKEEKVPVHFKKYDSEEHHLADMRADNELSLFEMAFSKEKEKQIDEKLTGRMREIAMLDKGLAQAVNQNSDQVASAMQEKVEKAKEELIEKVQKKAEEAKPPAKTFDDVKENTEIKGKRFVIIIDCQSQESKDALKNKLQPLLVEAGAKIF